MLWYLKQLLPLSYKSTYIENNQKHYTTWRMWFGRCFNIRDYTLKS